MTMESSQGEIDQQASLHQLLEALPTHVRQDWVDLHPTMNRLVRSLQTADSEETIRSESKITPQELFEIADIKQMEQAYKKLREKDDSNTFYQHEYAVLKKIKQEHGLSDTVLRQTLALSIVAASEAFSTKSTPFELWETQRIGLLRLTKNLSDPKSPGIVGDMRTGMGKTDTMGMIMIPVSLMVTSHVDMNSRTPQSRKRNMTRFEALGNLMGIQSAGLVQNGALVVEHGLQLFRPKAQDFAVTDVQVTFTTRKDLALYVLNKFHDGSYSAIQSITRGGRLCILDEIDAEELDESGTRYIISGKELPTKQLIGALWQPREYPFKSRETPNGQITPQGAEPPLSKTLFDEYLHKLDGALLVDGSNASADFKKAQIDADESLRTAYTLLQRLASYTSRVTNQDALLQSWDAKLLTPDGLLTHKGGVSLLRRLYYEITGKKLTGNERIPPDWDHFLNTIIPPEIFVAVGLMMKLQKGRDYFIDETKHEIVLQSPFTGWPQIGQEYEPLVMFALYAKECAGDEQIIIPKSLHNTADALSPAEFDALMYAKTLGLTGTGVSVADWFRRSRGMDITAIPPQYPERIDEKNTYISVPKGQIEKQTFNNKLSALEKYLNALKDANSPVIINVQSEEQEEDASQYLKTHFPQDKIEILHAENAAEATKAFAQAGGLRMRYIVRLMASREVDIAVDEMAESIGGLQMISLEPFPLRRQEIQFEGRTGRAGRQGVYRCFVSETDGVFSYLSQSNRSRMADAISHGDQRTIQHFIRVGQEAYEKNLQEQNDRVFRMYAPLVTIRRRLVAVDKDNQPNLKKDDFDALNIFWTNFLDIMETRNQSLGLFSRPTLDSKLRDTLWNTHVVTVFDNTLEFTKKLRQQNTPYLSMEEIQEQVVEYMNTHLGVDIGF